MYPIRQLIPPCMELVSPKRYRCRKMDFMVTVGELPLICGLCDECDCTDDLVLPPIGTRALHFAQALAKHTANGLRNVSEEIYTGRIAICNTCCRRLGGDCTICGCPVARKAWWESEDCPLGIWPELPQSGVL